VHGRALLVEDDWLARMALADSLRVAGLQVTDVPDGDAAARFLDHRDERLLRALPGLQERWEVTALAQLGDAQLQ
jgi:hypothetical protein